MDNMIRYVTYSNKLNNRIPNWTLTQKMESNPEILGPGRDHDIFLKFRTNSGRVVHRPSGL